MVKVCFHDEVYNCTSAEKGPDYIRLYDEDSSILCCFSGISNFSEFRIEGGMWSPPEVSQADRTEAQALYTALMTDTLLEEE